MPVNVLKHDNGIVNDQPDGQHEGEKRQRIDRKPRRIHDGKRRDERHGDRDNGDDGRPERMEEEKNNKNNQPPRLKDRREHILDRAVNEDGRVKTNLNRGSFRH